MANKNFKYAAILTLIVLMDTMFFVLNTMAMENKFVPFTLRNNRLIIDDTLKAYIGIIICPEKDERIAKANDKIRVGENLQIVIQSLDDCLLYIINESQGEINLLDKQILKTDSTYCIPKEGFYTFDGVQQKEIVLVLIFREENPVLEDLIKSNDVNELRDFLDQVHESSELVKPEKNLTRIEIGGNVRNIVSQEKVKLYAGKTCIFREYIFNVKK